jgi:hypothetical protein
METAARLSSLQRIGRERAGELPHQVIRDLEGRVRIVFIDAGAGIVSQRTK